VKPDLVAFSRMVGKPAWAGILDSFVTVDAAAEAAVASAFLIAFFRNKETINVDEIDLLKW